MLIQLRVGGQAARICDETIPLACGCIGQETTGAGGLAKALRTVPVVLEHRGAGREAWPRPDAWIVDFTNPVGIVTRALLDDGHRAVGLCNVAIGFQRRFAGHARRRPGRVVLDHVGLNHLTWERAVEVDGVDRLPRAARRAPGDEIADRGASCRLQLLALPACVPSYYLRYFYAHDEVLAGAAGRADIRGRAVADDRARAAAAVRRPGPGHQAGAARPSAAARSTRRRRST